MALVSTTISAAITATQKTFHLTSSTSVAAGRMLRVNDEFIQIQEANSTEVKVQRGKWGTNARAHGILSIAVHGLPADFTIRPKASIYTYGAAGAIEAKPGLHRLIAGSAAAMTLAAPTADMEGEELTIVAAAAKAYTVTLDSGYFNGATNTKGTFGGAIGDVFKLVVVGGSYCVTVNKNVTLAAS